MGENSILQPNCNQSKVNKMRIPMGGFRMKRVKQLKHWGIYENNEKEVEEYGFKVTVLTPDNMEYSYLCSPSDSDMEFETVEAAIEWIKNYNK